MNDDFYDWKNGMSQDDVKKVKGFVNSRKNLKDFYDHEDEIMKYVGDQFGDVLYDKAERLAV